MQDEALQDALREEAEREMARRKVLPFTKYTFRGRYDSNFHHRVIASALDAVVNDQLDRLIIEAPPRAGKSELVSRRFPAFYHARHPDREIIAASYGQDLANEMSGDTQAIMAEAEFAELFPEFEFGKTQRADTYRTAKGGKYKATGVGGPITGYGAHLLIIDDPYKGRKEAESETFRDDTWDWFTNNAMTRLRTPNAVVLMMTRWHSDDIVGRILNSPEAYRWKVLSFPAIQNQEPSTYDPRAEGAPLWPEFRLAAHEYITGEMEPTTWRDTPITREELSQRMLDEYEELKQRDAYMFSALYQGNPVPRDGAIVNADDFQRYMGHPRERAVHCDELIISVDANFKKTATSDFASLAVFGRTRSPAAIYLIDEVHKRLSFPQLKQEAKRLAGLYPKAKLLIEAKANGQALIDALKSEGYLRVIPFEPTKHGSKEIRFQFAADIISAGQVFLPQKVYAPWVEEWQNDIVGFGSTKHDDRADSLSMAAIHWLGRPSGLDHLRRITQGYRVNSAGKLRI